MKKRVILTAMARFRYTAEKKGGEVYKGIAEARDRFDLYEIIRREGARLVQVTEDRRTGLWSPHYWNTLVVRVSEYDKVLFARNLGAMLSAGLSLARSLSVIERQTKNLKLKDTVTEIESSVRRGDTLHQSFARFPHTFSPLFVAMVRAGEEGGDLPSSLTLVADQMERVYNVKRKIRGALIYPCIIISAIIGVGVLMMTSVVPTLAKTFADMHATLPLSTRTIIAISNFLTLHAVLSAEVFVGMAVALVIALRTSAGKRVRDLILLHIPLIGGLVREANAARTSRTLASLLSAGVAVLTALEISHEVVQNSYFREVITEAQKKVAAGEPLSVSFALREDLYPAFVGEMMAVGEETGQTPEMLKRLAIYYENQVDDKTRDMSTIIEPFLMIFIGISVGFFAVAMITPIYTLSSSI